jgi:hypothetical protein
MGKEVGQVSVLSLSLKAEKEQYLESKNVQAIFQPDLSWEDTQ